MRDLEKLLLPVALDARRGPALPPVVPPSPRPATELRRRVHQIARERGLVALPRVFALPVTSSGGGAQGAIDWQPPADVGPVVVVGIDGLATASLLSAGTYTARIRAGDRPVTEGTVSPGAASWGALLSALDPTGELPAPVVLLRGERLSVELLASGGTLVASAQIRVRALVFARPDRALAGPGDADAAASELRAEGELYALAQSVTSTTPNLESQWRAQYPVLWHGLQLSGLGIAAQGTLRVLVGGTDLVVGNGAAPGLAQLPTTTTTLPLVGDVAHDRGEQIRISLAGGNPDPASTGNTVDALWLGRVFR